MESKVVLAWTSKQQFYQLLGFLQNDGCVDGYCTLLQRVKFYNYMYIYILFFTVFTE